MPTTTTATTTTTSSSLVSPPVNVFLARFSAVSSLTFTSIFALACLLAIVTTSTAYAGPEEDRKAMRAHYEKRFPGIAAGAHKDGVYAFDENAREQWLELEDFPPYEIAVDEGEELFNAPLADGKYYSDCFADGAVKSQFPYFDEDQSKVITLETAINDCRKKHNNDALPYNGSEIAQLTAYIAFVSRGQTIAVAEPASEAALAAYNDGKRFYSSRRGQLNFACTSCHVQLAGNRLRAEYLSASLGHVSHWPVYRLKWQEVGSLHRRFSRCIKQVGAEPFAPQSPEYRNLEYFLTYISNGLPLNGPAIRK